MFIPSGKTFDECFFYRVHYNAIIRPTYVVFLLGVSYLISPENIAMSGSHTIAWSFVDIYLHLCTHLYCCIYEPLNLQTKDLFRCNDFSPLFCYDISSFLTKKYKLTLVVADVKLALVEVKLGKVEVEVQPMLNSLLGF